MSCIFLIKSLGGYIPGCLASPSSLTFWNISSKKEDKNITWFTKTRVKAFKRSYRTIRSAWTSWWLTSRDWWNNRRAARWKCWSINIRKFRRSSQKWWHGWKSPRRNRKIGEHQWWKGGNYRNWWWNGLMQYFIRTFKFEINIIQDTESIGDMLQF